jgi:putative ABC transport system ATP-binding protein
MGSAVSLRRIVKRYHRARRFVTVLDGFDLDIAAGCFVALTGPSGAGKTSLLNLIGGLDRPDSGTVLVDGVHLDSLSLAALDAWRARHVGFVFQADNLLPALSAAQNVELPLLLTRLHRQERRARIAAALAQVGLSDRAHHRPGELSGGQQQRVGIARAIVAEPPLLLCDEPTGDLDPATARAILDLLQAVNRGGTTVIMVTHDPAAAARAERVLHVEGGRMRDGAP